MHCKDIPTDFMIYLIITQRNRDTQLGAKLGDLCSMLPDFPVKVVKAKLYQMIRAGLIDGCTCGCRGDFTLKGRN